MDALGKAMFGRALRLRVLLWVNQQQQGSAFFQSEAARAVEYLSVSAVAKELDTLEALQMVRKFGRPSNNGRQNYVRTGSPYWTIIDAVEMLLDADSHGDGQTGEPQRDYLGEN